MYDTVKGSAYRVLIAEIIRPLDRVVHVPEPIVLAHVAERRTDTALGGDGVRTRRKYFRQHRRFHTGLRELQRRAQARAAGADDDRIEAMNRQRHAMPRSKIMAPQKAHAISPSAV